MSQDQVGNGPIPARWTEQADAILIAGREAGRSAREIAADLTQAGFPSTRNSVLGRLFRKGLSVPAPPKAKALPVRVIADEHLTGCRWPIGDPGEPGFRFCTEPKVILGKPYCAEHCAKAYRSRDEDLVASDPKPQMSRATDLSVDRALSRVRL